MPKAVQSKIVLVLLWATSVLIVGIGTYFLGWNAEAEYESSTGHQAPSLDAQLEAEGRYEQAIQVVLTPKAERPTYSGDYARVAELYLEWAKKDLEDRAKLAEKSASFSEKSVELAPNDPYAFESAMDNLNRAGDYSENGCQYYKEAQRYGEKAIVLFQGRNPEGRKYPTQQMRELIEPQLKRIRQKIEAWCPKTP